jgi:hypothetical protein
MGERAPLLDAIEEAYNSATEALMRALEAMKEFFDMRTPDESAEYGRLTALHDEIGRRRAQTWEEIAPLGVETATPSEKQDYISRVAAALEQDTEVLARLAADFNRLVGIVRARTSLP